MKLQTCIMAVLLLCMQGSLYAQQATQTALRPGDTIPDVALQMVNYTKAGARLHDLTDKLLVVVFWSPRCSSCAHEIATLDSLQRQFKDSLQFLLVVPASTGDTKASVQQFIKGYKQRIKGGFILPCAVEDNLLAQFFRFKILSECVWINKGIYAASTEAEAVTALNLHAVINNQPLPIAQKAERSYYAADHTLSDYISDTQAVHRVYPHIFEGDIESLEAESGMLRDSITGNRLLVINSSIKALYALAFRAPAPLYHNLIINKTDEPLFDQINTATAGNPEKLYNYELISRGNDEAMFQQMRADLADYFKVYGSVQKDTMPCLVLQSADTVQVISKGGIEGNSLYDAIQGERVIRNQPISVLTERLNELLDIPVTDETGIQQTTDLRLPNDLTDIPAMQKVLQQQGIVLSYTIRPVEVFVLKPTGGDTAINHF